MTPSLEKRDLRKQREGEEEEEEGTVLTKMATAITTSPPSTQSSSSELVPVSDNDIELTSSNGAITTISVTHRSTNYTFALPNSSTSTLYDLQRSIESTLDIPIEYQKLLIPKVGLIKSDVQSNNSDKSNKTSTVLKLPLLVISSNYLDHGKKPINLIGSFRHEVQDVKKKLEDKQRRDEKRKSYLSSSFSKPRTTSSIHTLSTLTTTTQYTFHKILPLPYFTSPSPPPSAATAFLTRLAQDPAISHIMQTRKFSVGLLTEMDPTSPHTNSRDSKLLGLNRNKGEVIELRLRTDDLEGFRDYKTIRRTLVHELVHNVWGDHDGKFWGLYRELEKDVEMVDRRSGGRRLVEGEYFEGSYLGAEEGEHVDEGGWTGGEYVLGGGGSSGEGVMSRREVLARAVEERMERMKRTTGGTGARSGDEGNASSSSGNSNARTGNIR